MADGSNINLESVGQFRVTSREGKGVLTSCGISAEEILDLPKNATVVEIGSGLFQEVSEAIKKLRDDIKTVSLDPTLGLQANKDFSFSLDKNSLKFNATTKTSEEKASQITYFLESDFGKNLPADQKAFAVELHHQRLREASKHGGVAALAPNLPLASESTNLVIDSFGPGTWLCETPDKTKIYLEEIYRLLKPGGSAVIFPIEYIMEYFNLPNTKDDKERIRFAKERVGKALENSPIKFDFFVQEVALEERTNNRLGIRLRNPQIP